MHSIGTPAVQIVNNRQTTVDTTGRPVQDARHLAVLTPAPHRHHPVTVAMAS
jgi:hypothetical protein